MDASAEGTAGPFEWLKNPRGRRSALANIHTAVRRGWLDGPEMADRRAALVDALVRLNDDPAIRPEEGIRILRIFMAMMTGGESPSRTERTTVRLLSRLSSPGGGGSSAEGHSPPTAADPAHEN